jgi:hypothetical protein
MNLLIAPERSADVIDAGVVVPATFWSDEFPVKLEVVVRDIRVTTLSGGFGEYQKRRNSLIYVVNGQPAAIAAKDVLNDVARMGSRQRTPVTRQWRRDGSDQLTRPVMPPGATDLTRRI